MSTLREAQLDMARFLRDPAGEKPPADIEPRRLQIYRDLVYRNIEGFISSAFPILRSLYADDAWGSLVREFILQHRCKTPLFLQISEEFLSFMSAREPNVQRPFEAELAHYEWLELAVDVAEGDVPPVVQLDSPDAQYASVSPAAQLGSYQFPVHRIGPSFQPETASDPTFLLVYRDREQRVQFMELSAGSARLIYEMQKGERESILALLGRMAEAWGMEPVAVREFGLQQLQDFNQRGVIGLFSSPA